MFKGTLSCKWMCQLLKSKLKKIQAEFFKAKSQKSQWKMQKLWVKTIQFPKRAQKKSGQIFWSQLAWPEVDIFRACQSVISIPLIRNEITSDSQGTKGIKWP